MCMLLIVCGCRYVCSFNYCCSVTDPNGSVRETHKLEQLLQIGGTVVVTD